nr:hypothetical protein [Tanacetum cinerariifolium]
PEEPEQAPLSPDYVPKPEYPEYLAPSDAKAPMKDQPLPDDALPTALSLGYVADFDSEEDPEGDPKEDPEASEDDDEEEEEHSTPTDSFAVSVDDLVPSAEDTKAFKTDESAPTPVPSPRPEDTEAFETDESAPTPIPSPPLPLPSPPTTSPTYAEAPLGYIAAKIRLRVISPSTYHPSKIQLTPLLLPSTSHRDDTPERTCRFERELASLLLLPDLSCTVESEARCARKAWGQDMDCNWVVHAELQAYRAQVQTHETHIQTWDARIGSMKTLVTTLVAQTSSLQTQLTTTLGRIQTLKAREPIRTDDPEDAGNSFLKKMPPKKKTATTTTTTPLIDAQIKALIVQGVTDALAKIKANRTSRNGDDNHDSRTGSRRIKRAARECTDSDFL